MISLKRLKLLLCVILGVTLLKADEGRSLYHAKCASCHGIQAEGVKESGSPKLSGQHVWYLIDQFKKIQKGQRNEKAIGVELKPGPHAQVMELASETMNEPKQLEALMTYISKLKPVRESSKETLDPEQIQRGKKVYALCSVCHGDQAEGLKAFRTPKLLDQHSWYIKRQLENFRMGWRGTHAKDAEGQGMRLSLFQLTEEDEKDVVVYIESLRKKQKK